MQKRVKYIIITLLVLLTIAMITIICIIKQLSNVENNSEIQQMEEEREAYIYAQENLASLINGKQLEEVKEEGIYLTINNIIKKYKTYLEEKDVLALNSILYKEYIKQNNVTNENMLDKLIEIEEYKIDKMYGIASGNYGIYYVKIYSSESEQFIMINWDIENETFSIALISNEEFEKGLREGVNVDEERIKSIEKNDYNKIVIKKITSKGIADKYFYDFIEKMLHHTEEAYQMLESQYKKINFSTYQDFLEYINYNKERIKSLDHNNLKEAKEFENYQEYEKYYEDAVKNKMESYAVSSSNGIKTYIFADTYGKYYIFKVSAAMKYTVILDNYTIPTEDFIQTYNESSEVEKVVLNIKRFFMGIDDKNYGYSYSVLSESYRANKYPTKDAFVQYAKQNFFEENEIEYISCEKQNGLYIYKIKIKDATRKNTEAKSLNMIVKLNDGTGFEMSFGTD